MQSEDLLLALSLRAEAVALLAASVPMRLRWWTIKPTPEDVRRAWIWQPDPPGRMDSIQDPVGTLPLGSGVPVGDCEDAAAAILAAAHLWRRRAWPMVTRWGSGWHVVAVVDGVVMDPTPGSTLDGTPAKLQAATPIQPALTVAQAARYVEQARDLDADATGLWAKLQG